MLKAKIGDKEAEAFVVLLENKIDKKFEEVKDTFATKTDIQRLEVKISESKSEILKWTFSFVFGALLLNVIAIYGVVIAIANIIKH